MSISILMILALFASLALASPLASAYTPQGVGFDEIWEELAKLKAQIAELNSTIQELNITIQELEGLQGPAGEDGADGTDGSVWYFGTVRPETENPAGKAGDMYLNTETGDVYVFFFEQVTPTETHYGWLLIGNLTGPTGADGQDGANGTITVVTEPTEDVPIPLLFIVGFTAVCVVTLGLISYGDRRLERMAWGF